VGVVDILKSLGAFVQAEPKMLLAAVFVFLNVK
jgi:hypothetical protein